MIKQFLTYIKQVFKNDCVQNMTQSEPVQIYVTLDWAGQPITTKGDGYILPRSVEKIINAKYYPTGVRGEWPVDPDTGQKLPIEPR